MTGDLITRGTPHSRFHCSSLKHGRDQIWPRDSSKICFLAALIWVSIWRERAGRPRWLKQWRWRASSSSCKGRRVKTSHWSWNLTWIQQCYIQNSLVKSSNQTFLSWRNGLQHQEIREKKIRKTCWSLCWHLNGWGHSLGVSEHLVSKWIKLCMSCGCSSSSLNERVQSTPQSVAQEHNDL